MCLSLLFFSFSKCCNDFHTKIYFCYVILTKSSVYYGENHYMRRKILELTHCTKNQSAWNRGFLAKESLNHHWRTPLDLIVNLVELHYSCHNFGASFRRYGNWWSLFEVAAIFVSVALVPFSWLVQLKVRLANHPRYVALYSLLRAKYRFGICMECRCHKISVNHCKKEWHSC